MSQIIKRKVIHRDLKPGNIFLDSGNNIRLGDFGLATTRKSRPVEDTEDASVQTADDIYHCSGSPQHTNTNRSITIDDSITGGVGTRFYCAPEQERQSLSKTRGRSDYGTKADIFSLGIVMFEMFHPPFSTMMHRAETLENLRGKSMIRTTVKMLNMEVDFLMVFCWLS